ncbi:MAG: dynamin family protein, partial [Brachymonas sp.]|nr:dynamin family protein [Brachymonas sp.]
MLKLSQPEFIDRLLRALVSRLRIVFERALNEIEQWSRKMSAQIDTQLRERKKALKRRIASIERAESAATGLDDRIFEIQTSMNEVQQDQTQFADHMDKLLLDTTPEKEPPVLLAF